jgi:hypothetical protein
MRPSVDRTRTASRTFKTVPKERNVEHIKPEREGSRSPVKTRPKEQPSPLPPPAPAVELETDNVAPQSNPEVPPPIQAPSKPDYVVSEGDPAFAKSMTVHFSTKSGGFVSTTPVATDYSEDTPSSTPDARILDKLEEQRKNRQNQLSVDATATTSTTEKLRNGLSAIDRAVQTSHWPAKERGTSAQTQSLEDAAVSCSAWEIYDAYGPPSTTTAGTADALAAPLSNSTSSSRPERSREHVYHHVTRVIQRMLYQNLNPEIPADFKVRIFIFSYSLADLFFSNLYLSLISSYCTVV